MNLLFSDIRSASPGSYAAVCRVISVRKAKIGQFLTLNDGTADQVFLIFQNSGLPLADLAPDEVVSIDFRIERQASRDNFPILKSVKRFEGIDRQNALDIILSNSSAMFTPLSPDFLVSSPVLDRLRDKFSSAASLILKSVSENRKIIIRHHGDNDGYCAAFALEKVIIPMIKKAHPSHAFRYYKRSACRTPFLDYSDATRELSYATDDMAFGAKEPLLIVVDNGSSSEDVLSLRKLRISGFRLIVVDHHFPADLQRKNRVIIDDLVDVHINPHLAGGSNDLTAGMLCAELSRFIDPEAREQEVLAAMSGITDKSSGQEQQSYLDLCRRIGYDYDFLADLSMCVDFEAFFSRSFDARGFIDVLLGLDREKKGEIIRMLIPEILSAHVMRVKVLSENMEKKIWGGNALCTIDLDRTLPNNSYPASGKSVGLLFDSLKGSHDILVVLGLRSDGITFRMTRMERFNLNIFIEELTERFPYSNIEGGGHENAGSIRFIPADRDRIADFVLERMEALLNA
ncbi:hypothetical protein JW968_06605 [Candidatus Woesearchaeota archaeon]|nr:hypothetical protein [Candidatus Woesearchaeota archaeon]